VAPTPRPYRESRSASGSLLREFSGDAHPADLIWHKDREERVVRVIHSQGWQLQLSEGLPFPLVEGNSYRIPARSWHRVIRGDGSLKIAIQEREKMKITESQLRKIVRQEILREGIGFTHMSGMSGTDRSIQRYVDMLGADAVMRVVDEVASEMGMDTSPDVRRREVINRLSDMSSQA
jgi:hypothetical protein